ncbi:MAG: MOSC domain-containing protein [Acidimicrobiales bacterium]
MTDTSTPTHRTTTELETEVDRLRASPRDVGSLALVVSRPAVDERRILGQGELDPAVGLVGDTWSARPSGRTSDGGPHPDMQLNVINAALIRLLAGDDPERSALAGDQLHLDLDLSEANLPTGTRLEIGDAAVIEVTDQPHTGCAKFSARFGPDALRFVNSPVGKELRLRGLNAKVVTGGLIQPGDAVRVVRPA